MPPTFAKDKIAKTGFAGPGRARWARGRCPVVRGDRRAGVTWAARPASGVSAGARSPGSRSSFSRGPRRAAHAEEKRGTRR